MDKELSGSLSILLGQPISRRQAMGCCLAGTAGLIMQRLGMADQAKSMPSARSVIQIWMWGGPSHLDTFDPKPDAGYDYCGPLNHPIQTNVDGIMIGELLPMLAKRADKYAIIRSVTHGINAHETASYVVQTGRPPGGRLVFPAVGAVVSLFKGYQGGYSGLIPPYIVLTEPQGRFSEAGFLGTRFRPFATGGDPAKTPFIVEGVVSEGITRQRQIARRQLLEELDALCNLVKGHPEIEQFRQAGQQAYDLILGEGAKVFDLAQEPAQLREAYGMNTFGQSCLMARRLVEYGVPYVTINYKGWDTHKQHFQTMRRRLPEMDKAMAALLDDLQGRGLLDSTIVWWSGEFGRTPKIQWEPPWSGGRGHWGHVFSVVLAGGGIKGGRVVGASDARGQYVAERPIYPADILATIYRLLDIDLDARLPNPLGLDLAVIGSSEPSVKYTGPIHEII